MVGTAGERLPVDQEYSRSIPENTALRKPVPAPILRNGALRFRPAYARCVQPRGPQLKKTSGRQTGWLTAE